MIHSGARRKDILQYLDFRTDVADAWIAAEDPITSSSAESDDEATDAVLGKHRAVIPQHQMFVGQVEPDICQEWWSRRMRHGAATMDAMGKRGFSVPVAGCIFALLLDETVFWNIILIEGTVALNACLCRDFKDTE